MDSKSSSSAWTRPSRTTCTFHGLIPAVSSSPTPTNSGGRSIPCFAGTRLQEHAMCTLPTSLLKKEDPHLHMSEGLREAVRASRWFTRGWTLQELIAPRSVKFFSSNGKFLGDKKTLEHLLWEITRIPACALRGCDLSEFTMAEQVS